MSFSLRWVGASEQELDRVAEARMRCYAHAAKELERFREGVRADPRVGAGDFLLAEQDGVAVGTATALPLVMWLRGAPFPCQGVAYVGTVKTHRRGASRSGSPGVATRVMHEVLRRARERGEVLSALMPFRASYYEHFGYGLVERRCDWTVPLSVLPTGAFEGVHFYDASDLPDLVRCRQRIVERGQCDIERPPAVWDWQLKRAEDGFFVVDRPRHGGGAGTPAGAGPSGLSGPAGPSGPSGPVHGWAYFRHAQEVGKDVLRVAEIFYEDVPTLQRLLHFFASLRDQYATAVLPLPADLPLNRLLRESQLPHRPVNHATAECRPYTRMQMRVLDHKQLIEAMRLPPAFRGAAAVAVHETPEGDGAEARVTRLRLELTEGRAQVSGSAGPGGAFECRDITWAAIVSGDLPATTAVRLGLAQDPAGVSPLLDAFAAGPAPFSGEYF